MKTILPHIVAILLATGLVGTATVQAATTVQVNVTVSIQSFASVSLDEASVQVTFVEGASYFGPVTVGGTVRCSVPVQLYARVTPPAGAPGTWEATAMVGSIGSAGVHHFNELLRVVVGNLPPNVGGQTYKVFTQGQSASTYGDIQNPQAGVVTLTVVPQ